MDKGNNQRGSAGWLLFAAAAIAATILVAARVGRPREVVLDMPEIDEKAAAADLDMGRIEADVRVFAAFGSRLSGRAGAARAFDHIRDELAAAGLHRVTVQEFPVSVPGGQGAHLGLASGDATSPRVPLHPLWPNLARTSMTPPDGLRGPLVDVQGGGERGLQGKRLKGAIVVMDWDSDLEWLSIPEFGGLAVIFRGNRPADGRLARRKFLTMPVDMPRFYVAAPDLPALDRALAAGEPAVVVSDDRWQEATARNLVVEVCPGPAAGADPDLLPIVFHAYYDSISVVPDLSPGAEQSCGAATLLELCRALAARPAPRPVHALFTGGHGQSLAGMTHYVKTLRESGAARPGLMVGLDLSSRSDTFGIFCLGHFRGQYEHLIRHKFSTLGAKLAEYAQQAAGGEMPPAGALPPVVDGINLSSGRGWWSFFPFPAPFESEIPTLAGIPGITLATVNDDRRLVDTPDDTAGNMRFDMLGRQVRARRGEHAGLLAVARAITHWRGPFVSSPLADRWAAIRGRAVWLDQRRNYTPNEPLHGATVFLKTGRGDKHLLGTRAMTPVMTDADGRYTFEGLIRSTNNAQFANCAMEVYGTADPDFVAHNPDAVRQYLQIVRMGRAAAAPADGATAASLPVDGAVVYAVDMARPSDYPWTVKTEKAEQHVNIVCFPCRTFSLLGLTDPRGYVPLTDIKVLNAATASSPFQFGMSAADSPDDQTENLATAWTDPTLRILLTLGVGFQGKRLILINNSPERPEGEGFVVDELTTLPSMILQGAGDMWNLDEARIRKLERNGVNNPRLRGLHEEAEAHIAGARAALDTGDYRAYRMAAEKAWALEGKAYGEALGLINNMIHGVLFYLALLLPLSYCLERLLVASETIKKRIIGIGGIFAGSFLLLALVHPAFRFTMTPLLVLLAFVIITLVVTVSVLIVGKMDAVLQERRDAVMGQHEDRRRRAGIAVRALDLGMSNIRRRPQRGFLTGLSVVMVTFILLSFTSLVPVTSISRLSHPRGTPTYRGLLARDRAWNPLPDALEQSLRRNFEGGRADGAGAASAPGAVVVARGWFFSDNTGLLSQIDLVAADGVDGRRQARCRVPALLCMEAAEAQVTPVRDSLVAGNWFASEEENGIILSTYVAGQLGYGAGHIGAPVRIFGEELRLAGIVDGERFDAVRDVDGEPLTPVNFILQREKAAQAAGSAEGQMPADTLEEYVHYPVNQVAIVPYHYGKRLGARVRSVAIKTPEGMPVAEEAEGYAKRSNLTILGADEDGVTLYAALNTSQLSAAWQIVIPMFLGFVMILGTMLGSVYERQGEIFVYNSVGLSPTNVASLFLAESAVYAIVGAGVGYLLGQTSAKVLQATGMLSGLTLNYTAGSTVFVTLLAMLMVFLSAIYPARKAFRAAIPDVEKGQDADAGATGDALAIYLPFVATAEHVQAMQAYLAEFLESIQGVTVGQLAVDNLQAVLEEGEHGAVPMLRFRAWMAPFDLGVSHDAEMRIVYRADRGVHQYHLTARRFGGDRQNWHRLTPRFIAAMRKQLLLWRVLSADDYRKYQQRGRELFETGT